MLELLIIATCSQGSSIACKSLAEHYYKHNGLEAFIELQRHRHPRLDMAGAYMLSVGTVFVDKRITLPAVYHVVLSADVQGPSVMFRRDW